MTIPGQVLSHAPARRGPRRAPADPGGAARLSAGGAVDVRPRESITLLHIAGPRFGRGLAGGRAARRPRSCSRGSGRISPGCGTRPARPDLLVVTGDLTESGSRRESAEAATFLTGLRVLLGLEPQRLIVVPGPRDITKAACRAYFSNCEADDVRPQPPYWPKWRHFTGLFEELYLGLDGPEFDSAQPWTLFPIPELKVVVAGMNSTMAMSHRRGGPVRLRGGGAGRVVRRAAAAVRGVGLAADRRGRSQPAVGRSRGCATPPRSNTCSGGRLDLLLHGAPASRAT